MAFTTVPTSGAKLRASVLSALVTELRPITAVKAAGTDRNTTTTRTADPDLALTLTPGTWEIETLLLVSSATNAAGDISIEFYWPSDGIVSAGALGLATTLASGTSAPDISSSATVTDTATPSGAVSFGCSTNATWIAGRLVATIVTTGAVGINWAQAGSDANNTSMRAGSRMTARMVA